MGISKAETEYRAELFAQGLKLCVKCGEILRIEEFRRHARSLDGLQVWCMWCHRAYRQTPEYRERDRARSATPERKEYEHERSLRRGAAQTPESRALRRDAKFTLWPGEYDAMREWKSGCHNCGCDEPGGKHGAWIVDHDRNCCDNQRACGLCNRGLLCNVCNIHEIHGVDKAVAAGRLSPNDHPYLADNWTHHREEWRNSH